MLSILTFLGGSAFRMIFGAVFSYLDKRQEATNELKRLELQGRLDAEQHARNMEAWKAQADMGLKVVQVQAENTLNQIEADAWRQAVTDVGQKTGIRFIDIWNGSIRPMLASIAIGMVMFEIMKNGFTLTDWDRELFGAILGIYVADRQMGKQGK